MKKKNSELISSAKKLVGKKYKYGASAKEAPEFFDCSSFVQHLFAQAGVKLPRSTIEQIECGKNVDLKDILPGDLIFIRGSKFHTSKTWPDGVGHVVIYAGDGKIIHAEGCRHNKVVLENLENLNLKELRAVKRIL